MARRFKHQAPREVDSATEAAIAALVNLAETIRANTTDPEPKVTFHGDGWKAVLTFANLEG